MTAMEKEKSTENDLDKKNQKEETEGGFRTYEVSYLLLPFIAEEEVPKEVGLMKENLSLLGGMIFSGEEPKLIGLAYPMFKVISNKNTKFENAYFGWIKFDSESENVFQIKKAFENNEKVLRFLILKTTKESPISRKSFVFGSKMTKSITSPSAKDDVKSTIESPKEINEAELDKTIEDLVIE